MNQYGEPWAMVHFHVEDCEGYTRLWAGPDRKRAVLCVNALAGVSDEDLAAGCVQKLVQASQRVLQEVPAESWAFDLAVALHPFLKGT